MRVETLSAGNFGGTTQTGSATLLSSGGEAGLVGSSQGASVSLLSGWVATVSFDHEAPVIAHTPPDPQPLNEEVIIEAGVDGARRLRSVTLSYRRGGSSEFTTVEMTSADGRYTAVIPAEDVTSEGAAYYISAESRIGRVTRAPAFGAFSIRVAVPEPGITMDEPITGGTEPSAYRIVSIPLDLTSKDPNDVLEDDLGAYDEAHWRLFELRFDQTLMEFPGTSGMAPGRGFWLIASEGERRIDSGSGTSADLSGAYSIQLHPGWNLVGTPFNFPIPVANVSLESSQSFLLRSFSGSWNHPIDEPVEVLLPFSGYAVFNNLHIIDNMLIEPGPVAGKGAGGSPSALKPVWSIRVIAESGKVRDADNVAAVAEGANVGRDPADYPEPPVIGPFVSVYFPHPEWGTPTNRYATDVRPETSSGHAWDLEVRGNVAGPVHLRFEGLEDVPESFDVQLVDEVLRQSQDLRASSRYTLNTPETDEPRRLQLVVGETDFVTDRLQGTLSLSGDYDLLPAFPNPFYSGTTIQYTLPEAATVSVRIFDVLGRELVALADNVHQEAGHHTLVWDGSGDQGASLSSGLYHVHLNASGRVITRTVVKVR